jgi:hypothetical protein
MGKVWVLDTETKGTGAEIRPLEEADAAMKRGQTPSVVRERKPRPKREPEPTGPRRFKVVDVMTGQVVLEGKGARETLKVLSGTRSTVDLRVYVWDPQADDWRALTLAEQKLLWERGVTTSE